MGRYKVRVLIVSQYFWPEEFRINEVCKTLIEKGIQVDVLTGKPNYPEGKIFAGYQLSGCQLEHYCGANISRVPLFPRGRNSGFRLALNYLSFIVFGLTSGPWLKRRRKYDVIFVYGLSPIIQALPALFLGWLKRVPVVIWVQDLWPQSLSATGYVRNRFVLSFMEHVVKFIYRHADLLLVQSQAFIEPVRALSFSTPVRYYPNSVDGSFALPPTEKMLDILGLEGRFSVVFAGNIGTAQGVEVIVEAAALLKEHKDIQFVVLGDGSCRQWMLQQVAVRKLTNLHLPGRFPVKKMPSFMQKASALLVTLTNREIYALTVPSKVQAYLAAGRPIIACLPGEGAKLVVEARAGVAVKAEDGKALAEAVLGLYKMSESARDEMGRHGRAYFYQHYDHERLVDQLIDELRGVVENKESIQ